ncbi:MAG TPA: FAD/NAD(P)-binding protein [Hypericibacter adhaerens]|uniref:FAD/NAD(P)-binding protein n=1 Tax=Hypericibacter adhaerens TaxID=2602016 RepID=UPI002C9C4590|nr:FAD/NAD(P)-binding protein [Hypericibacter adhaerens]HWA41897.1 FAD/NAD(P)-binding protein [Hypericibacter adhaerens]
MVGQGGKTIAIVGGGFSGSLLAFHLLNRCGPRDRILLIERNKRFGLGLAYSTGNSNHLLNVRAGNMSAISSRPSHFVEWLRELPREELAAMPEPPGATGFVPRGLFGRYVQHLLGDRIWREGRSRHLDLVTDDVVALRRREQGWEIELAMGRRLAADEAVLAIGNFPPAGSTPGYFGDPWDVKALAGLEPDRPVLILGTGLTMIDTVISLLDHGHRGPIYALSRRGLLPRVHLQTQGGALPAPWVFNEPPRGDSLVSLLRLVRAACREAEAQGRGWRVVIDGLRPHTQRIWQELSMPQRARFLRHLRPWWDVHRHRTAPQIMERILGAQSSGQLRFLTGRITGKDRRPSGGFAITVAPRGGQVPLSLTVERIIDCSGPRTDCTKIDQPLLRQLLRDGQIRPDPLRLGIEVEPDGAVVNRNGKPATDLFAIGPITKGTFWEIIAVPDIRVVCEQLAERLIPEPAVAERSLEAIES